MTTIRVLPSRQVPSRPAVTAVTLPPTSCSCCCCYQISSHYNAVRGRRTGSNNSGVSGRNTSVVKQRLKNKKQAYGLPPLRTPGKQKGDYSLIANKNLTKEDESKQKNNKQKQKQIAKRKKGKRDHTNRDTKRYKRDRKKDETKKSLIDRDHQFCSFGLKTTPPHELQYITCPFFLFFSHS